LINGQNQLFWLLKTTNQSMHMPGSYPLALAFLKKKNLPTLMQTSFRQFSLISKFSKVQLLSEKWFLITKTTKNSKNNKKEIYIYIYNFIFILFFPSIISYVHKFVPLNEFSNYSNDSLNTRSFQLTASNSAPN